MPKVLMTATVPATVHLMREAGTEPQGRFFEQIPDRRRGRSDDLGVPDCLRLSDPGAGLSGLVWATRNAGLPPPLSLLRHRWLRTVLGYVNS